MKKYIPAEFESKWQQKWKEDKLYYTDLSRAKNKYYTLVELPYSSGDLHIGHWFTFTYGDVLARFKRAQGYNALFPVGFDAFGLPAENAAIKRGIHPDKWIMDNVTRMKEQFALLGASIDWEKTTVSSDPDYYKWNQWIFLKMYEKGLAYKGKTLSSWCPSCRTVLAEENVEAGKCWRCGSEVVQKEIEQWFLKITAYADRLIWPETPSVDWPKPLRISQNDWIGKSAGTVIAFDGIEVFTTRPDTIFGATFLVISPEHPLLVKYIKDDKQAQVSDYVKKALAKSEQERKENREKTGVFTGSRVRNPLSGEKIPVWVADYVLYGYGTGAIMAVPAHDERDFEFAKKFNLDVKVVIEPILGSSREKEEERNSIVSILYDTKKEKYLSINWGKSLGGNLFIGGGIEDGEDVVEAASREIKEETGYQNFKLIGTTEKIHYHYIAHSKGVNRKITAVGLLFELEDDKKIETRLEADEKDKFTIEWLSTQEIESRVKDDLHKYVFSKLVLGQVYTSEGALVNSGEFTGLPSSDAREMISRKLIELGCGKMETHYHLHDWSISRQRYWGTPIPFVYCDQCGLVPVPESDLPIKLPLEVDYTPKGKAPLATAEEWVNTKCPKCSGEAKRETETMDGFMDNSWYFYRYLDPKNQKEIFDKQIVKRWMPVDIYIGGSEHTYGHALYSRFFTKFFKDLGLVDFDEYAKKRIHHGLILGTDGQKMSKSKGNVINPDEEVKKYGADAVRTYLSFIGPHDIVAPWNPDGVNGIYHFLERIWGLFDKVKQSKAELELNDKRIMHKTIKKVGEDIESLKYNTTIAAMMEWLNYLSRKEQVQLEEYQTFLILLAPFAPFISEELWSLLGQPYSIHQQPWPKFDKKWLEEEEIKIAVQVDGKVRDELVIQRDMASDREVIEKLAFERPKVKKYLSSLPPKKVVYIPMKIISIVTTSSGDSK